MGKIAVGAASPPDLHQLAVANAAIRQLDQDLALLQRRKGQFLDLQRLV
jgi:hypothetical protein